MVVAAMPASHGQVFFVLTAVLHLQPTLFCKLERNKIKIQLQKTSQTQNRHGNSKLFLLSYRSQ